MPELESAVSTELSNNEAGAIWMAHVLTELLEAWPAWKNLQAMDTVLATRVSVPGQTAALTVWTDMVLWLRDEGLIRVRAHTFSGSASATLTGLGYGLLGKAVPNSEKSTGAKLSELTKMAGVESAKGGARELGKSAAKEMADLLGSIGGSFVKSFSS